MTDEPAKPALVAGDTTADVITWTNRVGAMEGLGNIANSNSWSGRNNSAYLAGLAYFARTTDIRTDIPGTQTASTLLGRRARGANRRAARAQSVLPRHEVRRLQDAGELRSVRRLAAARLVAHERRHADLGRAALRGGHELPRPDNYFVAGEADRMVAGLTEAFAKILAEVRSSASSVAANSTRVGTDTAVFQAAFDSRRWSGEVKAFRIDANGTIAVESGLERVAAARRADRRRPRDPQDLHGAAADGRRGRIIRVRGRHRLRMGVADCRAAGRPSPDAERRPAGHPGGRPGPPRVPARLATERESRTARSESATAGSATSSIRTRSSFTTRTSVTRCSSSRVPSRAPSRTAIAPSVSPRRTEAAGRSWSSARTMACCTASMRGSTPTAAGSCSRSCRTRRTSISTRLPSPRTRTAISWTAPRESRTCGSAALAGERSRSASPARAAESIFALDVTDPATMTTADVLWEFTHPEMGNTLGQPAVAPLPNGEFARRRHERLHGHDQRPYLDARSGGRQHHSLVLAAEQRRPRRAVARRSERRPGRGSALRRRFERQPLALRPRGQQPGGLGAAGRPHVGR